VARLRSGVSALLLQSAMLQTIIGIAAGSALATVLAKLIQNEHFAMNTAAGSTVAALVVVSLTVFASSLGPLRATRRRTLSQVLRE
jgi:hypothetical protein